MRALIIICLTAITTFSYAQELMTIGEVFSFEVGDKFHYTVVPTSVPPAEQCFLNITKDVQPMVHWYPPY